MYYAPFDFRVQYVSRKETAALLRRLRPIKFAMMRDGKHLFSKPIEKGRNSG